MGAMLRPILRGEQDTPDLYRTRDNCHYGYSRRGRACWRSIPILRFPAGLYVPLAPLMSLGR